MDLIKNFCSSAYFGKEAEIIFYFFPIQKNISFHNTMWGKLFIHFVYFKLTVTNRTVQSICLFYLKRNFFTYILYYLMWNNNLGV